MKKLAVLFLAFSMVIGFAPVITVFAAAPSIPVVTDGADHFYENGGISGVTKAVDVFVPTAENTVYYYRIGDSPLNLNIYYQGDNHKPVGTFFSGSQVKGSHVASVGGANLDKITGTRLDPKNGNKITVPFEAGKSSVLRVIAYTDGIPSEVFAHTFMEPCFKSELTGDGKLVTTVATDPALGAELMIYTAAYRKDSGILVFVERHSFVSSAIASVDMSAYPLAEYNYKVFCWQADYVPAYQLISFE